MTPAERQRVDALTTGLRATGLGCSFEVALVSNGRAQVHLDDMCGWEQTRTFLDLEEALTVWEAHLAARQRAAARQADPDESRFAHGMAASARCQDACQERAAGEPECRDSCRRAEAAMRRKG